MTYWSVLFTAQQGRASQAKAALEELCRTCWPPLYRYVRREAHEVTEAQDLIQEFFARFLPHDTFACF